MCLHLTKEILWFLFFLTVGIAIGYGAAMGMTQCIFRLAKSALLHEEIKMVLVVRKDLHMGAGKVAAQCAHAAVATFEKLIEHEAQSNVTSLEWKSWFASWRATGCAKVVLQCADEPAMLKLATKAKASGLPYHVIRDAGRTQIAAGSKTVLSVGPGPKSLVDGVTGELKLY